MTDQKRVLLAFVLMAVVLVASQWWYSRMTPPPEPVAPADTTAPGRPVGREARETPALQPPGAGLPAEPVDGMPETGPPSVRPAAVIVETPLYRLSIDPRGGGIRQASLIRYPSFTAPGPVELVPPDADFLRRAADLDDRRVPIHSLDFVASPSSIRLVEGDSARTLTLTADLDGGRIVQSYRFDPEDYAVDYQLDLGTPVDGVLVTGIAPRLQSNEKNPREDYGQLRAVARVGGEIVTRQAKDVDGGEALALGGPIDWAGLRNKYFLAMVLAPPQGPPLSATTIAGVASDTLPSFEIIVGSPIEAGKGAYRIYLGPQEYRRLATLNEGLDDVNEYGWSWIRWMITPFAKGIVIVMLWLHQFIPSYGIVLIVFGLLVRLVMWPLTTKSYHSIRAMQELQPEIQQLRDQYKNDPQRMQQETMRLYREKKVNPLGGCLPNLIPMPILFALFFVFQGTIEFRGQAFLWLPDLSQPDPLYILPILMGLTMMASSKLTATDPRMAAMTYLMPIVLTFVFLTLAAGLVLYYTFSNLLTFIQQWWLHRSVQREAAEAASGATPG
ncbi:MAG TPA: membrane protein insertase YidC [Gemmatimonadota bacterium]|nr:membrane protein insertase YidC [Gemmatimonadota bacterium]